MMTSKIAFLSLILSVGFSLMAQAQELEPTSGNFSTCTMNVDGMPKSASLFGYTISLNPDATESNGATLIGQKFYENGYDIIGVNEDFDFEADILGQMNGEYSTGTHRQTISDITSSFLLTMEAIKNYLNKDPILDSDGLNLFWKTASVQASNESWTQYSTYYGYMEDDNDGLLKKGFRHYIATVADGVEIDVYITHMDADFSEGAIAAREVQIGEVVQAIINDASNRPKIFMGDTNCLYTYDRLKELFIDLLNATGRFEVRDPWVEQEWAGEFPNVGDPEMTNIGDKSQKNEQLDKVLYINCKDADYRIVYNKYLCDYSYVDENGSPLADHWPVSVQWTWYPAEDSIYYEHDLNANGKLDVNDIQLMAESLRNEGKGYSHWFLDVNRDGKFTIQDVSLLVDALKNR